MMKHAKLFNSVNDIARSHAQELLQKYGRTIQEGWNSNTRVLDVGCGDGSVTKLLTCHLPQAKWSACDISLDMIKFAKETYGESGVNFFHLDIRNNLKEELKERFDCVFCMHVLHRIHYQRVPFLNIHSLMKLNGRCLISIISQCEIFDVDRRMAKNPRWSPFIGDVEQLISPYHGRENPEKSLEKVMVECGFQDVIVTAKKFVVPDDFEKYRNIVKSVDPCLSQIPLVLHDEYLDDFFQLLADDGEESSPYYCRWSILEAIAHK